MFELFKALILSTIIITLWTAFILLQDKRGLPKLNRWFAAFLFALTTPQMDLYAAHIIPGGILLLSLVASTFLFLKGPFIWIFLSVLLRNDVKLPILLIHFSPWFASFITLSFFPQYWTIVILIGTFHMLIYLLAALLIIVNKRPYIAKVWQGFQNTAYYWLIHVVGGLILLMAIDFVVISLVMLGVLKTYNLLDYGAFPIFSLYVLSIGVISVYRPKFFFREADNKQTESNSVIADTEILPSEQPTLEINEQELNNQKPRYLELDITLAQALTQELTKLMQDKQLYRQNDLSLPDLAQALGISVHQLSELLNVHLGVNFYEFINRYRLKLACSLLNDPKCQLRVLDIAFESGFNNKNSFYRAFKDDLGITPNQYREQGSKQDVAPT